MKAILDAIFPLTHPTPFLGIVGQCFAWSAAATIVITLAVRFTFRRHKGLEDL